MFDINGLLHSGHNRYSARLITNVKYLNNIPRPDHASDFITSVESMYLNTGQGQNDQCKELRPYIVIVLRRGRHRENRVHCLPKACNFSIMRAIRSRCANNGRGSVLKSVRPFEISGGTINSLRASATRLGVTPDFAARSTACCSSQRYS